MKEKRLVKKAIYYVIVFVIGIIMICPLIWIIMSSSKENSTILSTAESLIPENFILSNYSTGWKGPEEIPFATFFQNSTFISVVITPGTVVSFTLVAYGLVRFKFRGRGILFATMLLSMMLPAQVFTTPQCLRCQKLGWVGPYMSLTAPYFFTTQGFFVYLISNFTNGIPTGLDGAVKIDGCSYACIFARIMLPLIKSALVMTCIFSLMWGWDDFPSALLYVNKSGMYPVSLVLKLFCDSGSSSDYGAMFATTTLSTLPSILTFLSFQRHLVEGISTSGLKG